MWWGECLWDPAACISQQWLWISFSKPMQCSLPVSIFCLVNPLDIELLEKQPVSWHVRPTQMLYFTEKFPLKRSGPHCQLTFLKKNLFTVHILEMSQKVSHYSVCHRFTMVYNVITFKKSSAQFFRKGWEPHNFWFYDRSPRGGGILTQVAFGRTSAGLWTCLP